MQQVMFFEKMVTKVTRQRKVGKNSKEMSKKLSRQFERYFFINHQNQSL